MSKNTDIERENPASLDKQSEKPKMNISELLRITPALEQVKTHKKEGALGLFGLICLSISYIILILLFSENLLLLQISDVDVLAAMLFIAFTVIGIVCIVFALIKVAKPLKAKVVVGRIFLLTLAVYLITIVKSLALGHLARLLFEGDYIRFELAKTGVDHASMLLGIVVAALSYSFLAALLRERKLEFKNFGKSFLTLTFWVALFYVPTFILSSIFTPQVPGAYLSAALVVVILIALLSSFFPLWFLAVGLSFHEGDEGEDIDVEEDTEIEEVDIQELEAAEEDN